MNSEKEKRMITLRAAQGMKLSAKAKKKARGTP
jgi:hypothetical protein